MFGICVAVKPTTSNSSRPRYTRLKLWKSRPAAPAISRRVRCMHRAYAATQDRGRLVFALALVAVVVGGWSSGSQTGPRMLLKLDSGAIAFGLNGPRFAWVGQHVVVADLASGKRSRVARGRTGYEEPVGVAASTVVWLEMVGGNVKIDTLRAASPGHEVRFGRWIDDDWYLGSGPRFGGVAAEGTTLVYGVYALTSLEQKSDRCYTDGVCHWRVSGGGTFLVRPGSLERQRILPPSTAVAVEGKTVAAATRGRGGDDARVRRLCAHVARAEVGPLLYRRRLSLAGERRRHVPRPSGLARAPTNPAAVDCRRSRGQDGRGGHARPRRGRRACTASMRSRRSSRSRTAAIPTASVTGG